LQEIFGFVSQFEVLPDQLSASQFHSASSDVKVILNLCLWFVLQCWAQQRREKLTQSVACLKKSGADYFIIQNNNNKVLSLVCNELIAVFKEYNFCHHCGMKHAPNYEKFTGKLHSYKLESNVACHHNSMF
jgi:hypothetical protein